MSMDRKRSPAREVAVAPESFSTAASSSSAFARQPFSGRAQYASTRTESPPASAYFSEFAGDDNEPQPTPDASAHFAYSTTLRRHHTLDGYGGAQGHTANGVPMFTELRTVVTEEGAGGLWERVTQLVRAPFGGRGGSSGDYERIPTMEEKKDTPSARFVFYSIEVSAFPDPSGTSAPSDVATAVIVGSCMS